MPTHATLSLGVFLLAYALFVILPHHRTITAISSSLILVLIGALGPVAALGAINWNVMGIFVGTLFIADAFIESRVPAYLAEVIVNKAPSVAWAQLFMCLLTSTLSMFVENVATVLIIAPIAMSLAKKLDITPIPMMIGIAISSNLQGTATLIGDPPSMLLGGYAKMTFMDFFFYHGKPSIFFAVQTGAIASAFVLFWVFRKNRQNVTLMAVENVKSWVPSMLLVVLIAALAVSSFFDKGFSYAAGIICMLFGAMAFAWHGLFNKGDLLKTLKQLDWDTTFFLIGVFVLVGGLTESGWTERIARGLGSVVGENVFLGYTLLVVVAIAVSAFVDNVPFLAAMLPVAGTMAKDAGLEPSLYLFGLLIGASLGGNITPIGASANIVACGLMRREVRPVSFGEWLRISIPFTAAAVIPAYLFVWFIWR